MPEEQNISFERLKESVLENFTKNELPATAEGIAYTLWRTLEFNRESTFYNSQYVALMRKLGLIETGEQEITDKGKQLFKELKERGYFKPFEDKWIKKASTRYN